MSDVLTRLALPHTVTTNKRGGPVNTRTGAANCPFCGKLISMDRRCQHVEDVEPPNVLVLDPDAPPLPIATTEVERGMAYHGLSLQARIRAVLADGQASTSEIAAELGINTRRVSAALLNLIGDGTVEITRLASNKAAGVYALTERGMREAEAA